MKKQCRKYDTAVGLLPPDNTTSLFIESNKTEKIENFIHNVFELQRCI